MEDLSNLALNIDRLMRRIHSEIQPQAADFDQYKVGPLGGMLLLTIAEREPVEIQAVVDALGRDKSQISRLIQNLERKGLLIREKSSIDGRVSLLSLTQMGQDQLHRIQNVLTRIVDQLFDGVSPQERRVFADILERVLDTPGR